MASRGIFEDEYEGANFILCLAAYPELLYRFLKDTSVDTDCNTKTKNNRKIKPSSEDLQGSRDHDLSANVSTEVVPKDPNSSDPLDLILAMQPEKLFL